MIELDHETLSLLKAMEAFCFRESRLPDFHETEESFHVGRWRRRLDALRLRGQLLTELSAALEQIEHWQWTDDDWYSDYEEVEHYLKLGNVLPDYLNDWLHRQLHDFENFFLGPEKIPLLTALPVECRTKTDKPMTKTQWNHHCRWNRAKENLQRFYACHQCLPTDKRNGKEEYGINLCGWLQTQRDKCRAGELTPAQIAKLDAICRDWMVTHNEKVFQQKIEWLTAFYREHSRYPDGDSWVVETRIHYRQGTINAERIPVLEALPEWSWDPQEERWQEMYAKLVDFVKVHGRIPAVKEQWKGAPIGSWAQMQRQVVGRMGFSPHHRELLEKVHGWVWNMLADFWQDTFAKLEAFIKEHGRLPVKGEVYQGSHLSVFVQEQRRKTPHDSKEGRLLESLPYWRWDYFEEGWEDKLEEFKFAISTGGEVDQKWVIKQRTRFAKGLLSPERNKALEAMPNWEWRPHEASWKEKYEALKAHFVLHDSLPDLKSPLGSWYSAQRRRFHKGSLRPDRREMLESLPLWRWQDEK